MGQWSTRITLAAGDPVSVTPVNSNFSAIAAILNGNIDVNNLANDAVTSAKILDGTIVNANINAAADIDYSKLSVPAAAIAQTKLGAFQSATGNLTITSRSLTTSYADQITVNITPAMNAYALVFAVFRVDHGSSYTGYVRLLGDSTILGDELTACNTIGDGYANLTGLYAVSSGVQSTFKVQAAGSTATSGYSTGGDLVVVLIPR